MTFSKFAEIIDVLFQIADCHVRVFKLRLKFKFIAFQNRILVRQNRRLILKGGDLLAKQRQMILEYGRRAMFANQGVEAGKKSHADVPVGLLANVDVDRVVAVDNLEK